MLLADIYCFFAQSSLYNKVAGPPFIFFVIYGYIASLSNQMLILFSHPPLKSVQNLYSWVGFMAIKLYFLRTFNITHLTVIWLVSYILIEFVGSRTNTKVLDRGVKFQMGNSHHPIPTSGKPHPFVSTLPPTFFATICDFHSYLGISSIVKCKS